MTKDEDLYIKPSLHVLIALLLLFDFMIRLIEVKQPDPTQQVTFYGIRNKSFCEFSGTLQGKHYLVTINLLSA